MLKARHLPWMPEPALYSFYDCCFSVKEQTTNYDISTRNLCTHKDLKLEKSIIKWQETLCNMSRFMHMRWWLLILISAVEFCSYEMRIWEMHWARFVKSLVSQLEDVQHFTLPGTTVAIKENETRELWELMFADVGSDVRRSSVAEIAPLVSQGSHNLGAKTNKWEHVCYVDHIDRI